MRPSSGTPDRWRRAGLPPGAQFPSCEIDKMLELGSLEPGTLVKIGAKGRPDVAYEIIELSDGRLGKRPAMTGGRKVHEQTEFAI
jgi:hypothetical protein